MDAFAESVQAQGMTIQSLHAPHKGIARLWEPGSPLAAEPRANVLSSIDACARYGVPILVVHGWQGFDYTFPEDGADFRIFDEIVCYAGEKGVTVAFENLEGEEYLNALMTRYAGISHVGFCWDSGHDHCYPHKLDFLRQFGHRLIMTHLNDNLGLRSPAGTPSGNDDLHFLPFDGNLDWDRTVGRLQDLPRQSILNFEIKTCSHSKDPRDLPYADWSVEQFLTRAGICARQIACRYDSREGIQEGEE